MATAIEQSTQYLEWLNSLDDTVRKAYEDHCGDDLKSIYERLKVKWEMAVNPDNILSGKLNLTDILDILDAEMAEIRAEAERLDDETEQISFLPDIFAAKESKKKELADRAVVVNLIQNEVTNKMHGVLSKNIPLEQIEELKTGRQDKIISRNHTLTYDKIEKILKISDNEGFDILIEGLGALSEVKKSGGKKGLDRELRQTTAVLLDRIMIAAAEQGNRTPRGGFALKDYMTERGLSDEKSLRQQVERDLDVIFGSKINWTRRGKNNDFRDLRIIGEKGIKNGIVFYEFTRSFFDLLKNNKNTRLMYMQFPIAILRAANAKTNPWAYILGRRAALHRHINRGHRNENIIGINTLLSACPDFPTLEEIMATTRDVTRRMIEPFERDMNAQSAAYTWEYQDGERPKTGKEFIAANVVIHWKDDLQISSPSSSRKAIPMKKADGQ